MRKTLTLLFAALLVMAGCGGSDESADDEPTVQLGDEELGLEELEEFGEAVESAPMCDELPEPVEVESIRDSGCRTDENTLTGVVTMGCLGDDREVVIAGPVVGVEGGEWQPYDEETFTVEDVC